MRWAYRIFSTGSAMPLTAFAVFLAAAEAPESFSAILSAWRRSLALSPLSLPLCAFLAALYIAVTLGLELATNGMTRLCRRTRSIKKSSAATTEEET